MYNKKSAFSRNNVLSLIHKNLDSWNVVYKTGFENISDFYNFAHCKYCISEFEEELNKDTHSISVWYKNNSYCVQFHSPIRNDFINIHNRNKTELTDLKRFLNRGLQNSSLNECSICCRSVFLMCDENLCTQGFFFQCSRCTQIICTSCVYKLSSNCDQSHNAFDCPFCKKLHFRHYDSFDDLATTIQQSFTKNACNNCIQSFEKMSIEYPEYSSLIPI